MTTLVAGAPLLAGGPPGWVAYGLLAVVTIGGAYIISQNMSEADDNADDMLNNSDQSECTGDCAKAKEERQKKRRDELEDEAGVEQKTKGKTKHGEKDGGMSEADKDFELLEPDNSRPIDTQYGPGRTGTLEDGSKITVRPGSSDGRPTLQIRNPNGRQTEIRYNNGPGA